jgi:hypothetical protein
VELIISLDGCNGVKISSIFGLEKLEAKLTNVFKFKAAFRYIVGCKNE